MASITFLPSGLRVECKPGESVYEVAWRASAPLSTACGAKATCGLCRIKVVAGEEHLNPLNEHDKKHVGNVYFITKVRLGCQARLVSDGDVVVEPIGAKPKTPPAIRGR